jgi:hypothetical protein
MRAAAATATSVRFSEVPHVVCHQHPNRSGRLWLRVGTDKFGNPAYFEASAPNAPSNAWTVYRDLNENEVREFNHLLNSQEIVDFPGPSRTTLHYHVCEL